MARLSPDRLEQAAHWHVSLNEGELDASEHESFLDWLADGENAQAFDAVSRSWKVSGEAVEHPAIKEWLYEVQGYAPAAPASGLLKRVPIWALVASLVVAVMASTLFFFSGDTSAQQFATEIAQRQDVTLDDGSLVSLDADSVIAVEYSKDARIVTLTRGRAQFDVAKEPDRPFTVYSGDQAITATGTSFTVEALSEETRVVLLEGEVEVRQVDPPKISSKSKPVTVTLRPGELFVAQKGVAATPSVSQTDLADASRWQSGYLTFDGEPLANVASRFNRYSSDKLEIADPAPSDVRVSGTYKADDVSALLEGLEAIHGIRAVRQGETITLSRLSVAE